MTYSSRLQWSSAANAISAAIENRRRSGQPILDLTQSNPTAAGIAYPALDTGLLNDLTLRYEPDPAGLLCAREAVAAYYGNGIDPEDILLTASTSEAYSYLFKLLCDPGDEVLVPRPSYPLFDMLAQLECVRVVQYPLHYQDGWFVDVSALRNLVTGRTRAVIWVNPNNPTGSYLKRPEYDEIAAICRRHGLALISDEVFTDYEFEAAGQPVRSLTREKACLSFSLSGLSKVSGLPQMKLGWIVAKGSGRAQALERLEWVADAFLSVSAPIQFAAASLLQVRHDIQAQIRQRTAANLASLRESLARSACRTLRVEGGWYATVQVPRVRSEEEWVLELLNRGVLVQPGYFFDFESEAFLVISLLTEPAVFQQGVRHILDAC